MGQEHQVSNYTYKILDIIALICKKFVNVVNSLISGELCRRPIEAFYTGTARIPSDRGFLCDGDEFDAKRPSRATRGRGGARVRPALGRFEDPDERLVVGSAYPHGFEAAHHDARKLRIYEVINLDE